MRISRRSFLAASAGALVVAACSDGKGGATSSTASSSAPASDKFVLASLSDTSALVPGSPQRLTFGIADSEGVFIGDVPDTVNFDIVLEGASGVALPAVVATKHEQGLPRPYYPIEFTPPSAGIYTILSSLNGTPLQARIQIPATTDVIGVGQPMVPLDTPTPADGHGVDPICTRTPACPLHDITLREALGSGQPVAFLISTPGHCKVAICGPVLDVLLAQRDQFPQIKMLHAEVYLSEADAQPGHEKVTEAVSAYRLSFEPVLYLARPDGIIVKRVDTIFDAVELHDALAQLIS